MTKTNKTKALSPEQKLMNAIFGKNNEHYDEVMDKYYENQANSVTDEEFKKMWGVTPDEHAQHMLEFIGWCNAVSRWEMDNNCVGKDMGLRQLTQMAEYFYKKGRQDESAGITLYDSLWSKEKQGE